MKRSTLKKLTAFLLAAVLFLASSGCEQEIALLLLASDSDTPPAFFTVELSEQDAATHILITDADSQYYGLLSPYLGTYVSDEGSVYACHDGYFPSESAMRVIRSASDSDLMPADELWLRPSDNAKLRLSPSYESGTAALLSSSDILPVSAVSFTDTLYFRWKNEGYISADASAVSAHRSEFEFYILAKKYAPVGAQLTVIENGKTAGSYAYGFADLDTGRKMTTDTRIRCASLSKVLFAIAALKMQNEGLVDIDKNIGAYIGSEPIFNPSYPDIDITLRTVMTHTSSVREFVEYPDNRELFLLIGSPKLFNEEEKPGVSFRYNNFAVGLGGSALELACGRTMQDYVSSTIFRPLSINACYGMESAEGSEPAATLYDTEGNPALSEEDRTVSYSDIPGSNSRHFAGGLCISSEDYAKLLLMLINNGSYNGISVIPSSAVAEMEKEYFSAEEYGSKFSQGLILRKAELYGRTLYYHTGKAYGTVAIASYDPETGDGLVFMATGADAARSKNGIYEICNAVSEKIYSDILSKDGE